MSEINWAKYPKVAEHEQARTWLTIQVRLGLSANTLDAYSRGLEDYFAVCQKYAFPVITAKQEHIALYVNDMATRECLPRQTGLANATMQQRLTAVRLFYDYLVEEGLREKNPVGRGKYVPGRAFAGARDRGLLRSFRKLPWIPNDEEWRRLLGCVRTEPLRNRLMFAMAYDSALRREELCSLETGDIDPAHRLLHIRAETTKTRQDRVVPYSVVTSDLLQQYLRERRALTQERGALFRAVSPRNRGAAVSIWTWSKVVRGVALRAALPQFSTHSLRHLCLTDLARADWDLHEIALFAGHRSTQTTLQYVHLSGRELSAKFAAALANAHTLRLQHLEEVWR
jgi:integrase/recombinase XerD